ncbi:uncharacterized protein LOC129872719 [Solanum dulcamara]|uniref:uncharacterized protein LOC129872719 n=1 Tax=Solanum dulcamara TaxID=45834 RepID=UPI002485F65B|nr:uncharacterized protein LOC129872719 [Solanum dulcamara]
MEKRSYILGIGRIRKCLEHFIEDVYYVNGLKYSLLSVSQICDKGNEVRFLLEMYLVISLSRNKVMLIARRCKNIYVADLSSALSDNLTSLRAQDESDDLWHRRLGHVSTSLLNKHIIGDLKWVFVGYSSSNSLSKEFADLMKNEFEMSNNGRTELFLELKLDKLQEAHLYVKRNADFVGYLVDKKSTFGMVHFLGSSLISWGTKKQHSVALSIAEAEYVDAEDFGVIIDTSLLLCDNTSALNMAKIPVQHKRNKHIDVRHHFLRDNIEKGNVCVKFCTREDQIADIFTKALSREQFEKNRLKLRLINLN